jgi:hypothetical protein
MPGADRSADRGADRSGCCRAAGFPSAPLEWPVAFAAAACGCELAGESARSSRRLPLHSWVQQRRLRKAAERPHPCARRLCATAGPRPRPPGRPLPAQRRSHRPRRRRCRRLHHCRRHRRSVAAALALAAVAGAARARAASASATAAHRRLRYRPRRPRRRRGGRRHLAQCRGLGNYPCLCLQHREARG